MAPMNREFLDDFVTEAREHLSTAEEDVLAIERDGADVDSETVNRLFRAVHTVKGGAGLLELRSIQDLSHSLENVMGRIRNKTLNPDSDVTERLLRGLDRLSFLIDNVEDETIDTSAEVAALREILDGQKAATGAAAPVPEASGAATFPAFDLSKYDLSEAIEQGQTVFECLIDLSTECAGKGRSLREMGELLRSIGTLIDSSRDLSSQAVTGQGAAPCSVLFTSVIDDVDIISEGLGVSFVKHKAYKPSELPKPGKAAKARKKADAQSRDEEQGGRSAEAAQVVAEPVPPKATPAAEPLAGQRPSAAAENSGAPSRERRGAEQTVRISLPLLDQILNLAGELVLVRNQNMQAVASRDLERISAIGQRLNVVTTELQTSIMQTRMRPVGGVFSRFTRVVRDLARKLGKEIDLEIIGSDVELDKSIVESIADPLTHLIRNAADHGIESPADRQAKGKAAVGHVRLSAFHESGQVNIQITDDGKGLDPAGLKRAAVRKGVLPQEQADILTDREAYNLIFAPGFSTAEAVTDVSGRGVGMDVVKSAFQKLGGAVDISSAVGKGTTITIKLPLTLAVLPSLIVTVEKSHFAIPQVNIDEVVWLHGHEVYQDIQVVDNREVYRLRGRLFPLLRLSEVLGMARTFSAPDEGVEVPDRRRPMPDRRQGDAKESDDRRDGPVERRTSLLNSVYIIVVKLGGQQFGVVVDRLVDTEEIVVKALHDQLKSCRAFSGTAVLGDGRIAMILDIAAVADLGGIRYAEVDEEERSSRRSSEDSQTVLLFDTGGHEQFALPLSLVRRVEEVSMARIQIANDREYLNFRNELVPLVRIEKAIPSFAARYPDEQIHVVIPKAGRPIGIVAARILDTIEVSCDLDVGTVHSPGVVGSKLIDGRLTLFLDVIDIVERVEPDWFTSAHEGQSTAARILLVEDSSFYQALVRSYLRGIGADVRVAGDGVEALELLASESFDGIVSDLEMPRMGGIELARRVKATPELAHLPMVAISSADESYARSDAMDAGFLAFQPKYDPDGMLQAVTSILRISTTA